MPHSSSEMSSETAMAFYVKVHVVVAKQPLLRLHLRGDKQDTRHICACYVKSNATDVTSASDLIDLLERAPTSTGLVVREGYITLTTLNELIREVVAVVSCHTDDRIRMSKLRDTARFTRLHDDLGRPKLGKLLQAWPSSILLTQTTNDVWVSLVGTTQSSTTQQSGGDCGLGMGVFYRAVQRHISKLPRRRCAVGIFRGKAFKGLLRYHETNRLGWVERAIVAAPPHYGFVMSQDWISIEGAGSIPSPPSAPTARAASTSAVNPNNLTASASHHATTSGAPPPPPPSCHTSTSTAPSTPVTMRLPPSKRPHSQQYSKVEVEWSPVGGGTITNARVFLVLPPDSTVYQRNDSGVGYVALADALSHIEAVSSVAVDCEGTDEDTLAIVQVGVPECSPVYPRPCVYIFDVVGTDGEATEVILAALRTLFVNAVPSKVFHDCRWDVKVICQALNLLPTYVVSSIVDTQVLYRVRTAYQAILPSSSGVAIADTGSTSHGVDDRSRIGLNPLLQSLSLSTNTLKDEMHARFDSGADSDADMWRRRPLDDTMLRYAAMDVTGLLAAADILQDDIRTAAGERLVRLLTEAHARESCDDTGVWSNVVRRGSKHPLNVDLRLSFDEKSGVAIYTRVEESDGSDSDGWSAHAMDVDFDQVDGNGDDDDNDNDEAASPAATRGEVPSPPTVIASTTTATPTTATATTATPPESGFLSATLTAIATAATTTWTTPATATPLAPAFTTSPVPDMSEQDKALTELHLFVMAVPHTLRLHVEKALRISDGPSQLVEVVVDCKRPPSLRYADCRLDEELSDVECSIDDVLTCLMALYRLDRPIESIPWTQDNRACIPGALHRVSSIRRGHAITGLTMRVGRPTLGRVTAIHDMMCRVGSTKKPTSMLLLGRPGVGKTSLLRGIIRHLADDLGLRVVVIDTSNEIAGDSDEAHWCIGRARRMFVSGRNRQHEVMLEAVQNHQPHVVVIDEIGTSKEAHAAKSIAHRGIAVVATAHGRTLGDLLKNPDLLGAVGGVQSTTLNASEAKKRRQRMGWEHDSARHSSKAQMERKGAPTFDMLVEMHERNYWRVHHDVGSSVDTMLDARPQVAEYRWVSDDEGGTAGGGDGVVMARFESTRDGPSDERRKRDGEWFAKLQDVATRMCT